MGGAARIGNRRNLCDTCNRFNQKVMRVTRSRLKERHSEEYLALRKEVERDLYYDVIAAYVDSIPESAS